MPGGTGGNYDVLSEPDFRALYDAVKAARQTGTRFIRIRAGDTEFEKERTIDTVAEWPGLAAEFRLRFPSEVGRMRITRTRAVFAST